MGFWCPSCHLDSTPLFPAWQALGGELHPGIRRRSSLKLQHPVAAMEIGCKIHEIDTPFLWVEMDVLEENIGRLSSYFREAGVAWRPHVKGIKIPALANMMVRAGAIGVTCAKLSEAEVMVAGGIDRVLIANQVVGAQKIARLVGLCRYADVIVAVDDLENVLEISQAAMRSGVRVGAVIEVDIGINRCGVEPGEAVVELAEKVWNCPGIDLAGVMGWEGHCVRIKDPHEKEIVCRRSVGSLVQSAEMCREKGFPMKIVSCGGSGTYWITAHIPGVTEIQAGGAIMNSVAYREWGVRLEFALFLQASVLSHPNSDQGRCRRRKKGLGGRHG